MKVDQLNVLIVDDFELARSLLKGSLADLGITKITEAEDGEKALNKLDQAHATNKPFDIVFTDWNMPGVTGLELIKTCMADERYKVIPFVMVTAESETDSIVEALQAGVSDFINKPITRDNLSKKIDRIFQTKLKKAA